MRIHQFYKPILLTCFSLLLGISGLFANNDIPLEESFSPNDWTQCTGSQVAYWSLDNCVSFASDGSNLDYSELTSSTNTPNGFNSINATNLTANDGHSCVYGQSGAGFCHGTRTNCGWVDNDHDAIKFSVTVNPTNGYSACLTKLSFYESAPHNFVHISGNSGDNDPPSKYGVRVLKDGQEIYQSTNNNTSAPWSLEQFNFSSDPDFIVTSSTVFTFELLGYCRQGSNGLAAWDLDEIKVYACAEQIDPCANQGGDSDGDGVCDNQDCKPNNPNFPAVAGSSCNDGDSNTENDVVTADGCDCAGTPVGPSCTVTTDNCTVTISGLTGNDYIKLFDSNWNIVWSCNPWVDGGCNATEVISDLSNGTYYVDGCGSTITVNVSGCNVDPCAGQGGDSDGDGVCDNQDCKPNNPNFPAAPGSSCNDGNPNTENDVVTADGCGCEGTPVGPSCNVTTGNCSITITGLNSNDYTKVFDDKWNTIWTCNPWNGNPCNNTETISSLTNGTYYVEACGQTTAYTVSGCSDPCGNQGGDSDGDGVCDNQDCKPNNPNYPANPGASCDDGDPNTNNDVVTADGCGCEGTPVGPCAGQGGDSDGDGICDDQDCKPYNSNYPANPGASCDDGNPNTNNDVVTADGCGCEGTPVGPSCNVTTGNCSITITGLNSNDYAKVFDDKWNTVWSCNPWNGSPCNSTETISNLTNGTYYVEACGQTTAYTVSGCSDPCGNQGGDSDGDGVCDNQDCKPNNPNFPAAPGSSCNDGNPNTTNDVVTADGCGCAGMTTDPCAGQGGDTDGDGVCDNQDCRPNNPNFPAAPGASCNDGNPDTENDVVSADGCDCAGTPVGPSCNVTTDDCSITISGLTGNDYIKVFDSNWNIVWDCNPWVNGGCNSTEVITDLNNGTYYVDGCGSTLTVNVSGCTVDPCAGQGGDADGDGVCDDQDCRPNNPNFPANPGSSCDDGNPDTENDVVSADGCNCAGTPVNVCNPTVLAHWDMNNCDSYASTGTNTDFSEFTANTNTPNGFSIVNATILNHDDGVHSCTQGQSGYAICSGTRTSCSWSDNSDDAFKFSITVRPDNGGTASLTKLNFYERAPSYFQHISGNSGDNDPPSHYGFRVLKNGQEIYQNTGNNTTENWSLESFDFTNDSDFVFTSQTTFEFELLGYCRQGSGGLAAWDLDEIKIYGCSGDASTNREENYLDFQANRAGLAVDLSWITNTDFKNDYFEVERSTDGINFEMIDEVVSTSSSESLRTYEGTDADAVVGMNFYRVKQVYNDGDYRYSQVRQVSFETDVNDFTIFPNPTFDGVYVNLKDFAGMEGVISIYNSLGQPVYAQEIDEISDEPIRISTSDTRAGVHVVAVKIGGRKIMTKVLIITKL